MDLSLESAVVTLQPGTALRVRDGAGRRISQVQGTIWVTQDGDTRDLILESGADLVLERSGNAVLQALGGPARVALEDGIAIGATWPQAAPAVPPHGAFDAAARRLRAEEIGKLFAGLRAAVRGWLEAAARRLNAERTAYELRALSDHQLRDIGLRRSEIDCIAR